MKNLMESIDDIYSAEEEFDTEESTASPEELLKEIISSLKELSSQIADGSIEDLASLTADLQSVSDSLKELASPLEESAFSIEGNPDDEDCGADGMGPKVSPDGMQDYANPQGQSYAARKGFVGI